MGTIEDIFPFGIGSYWVYTDQDGNELLRRVSSDKIINGKRYKTFEYQPKQSDIVDLHPLIHAGVFDIEGTGVFFFLSNALEDAFKSRLKRELEIYTILANSSFEGIYPPESGISINITFEVDVESENKLTILDILAAQHQEWKVTETKARIILTQDIHGLSNFNDAIQNPDSTLDLIIRETGKAIESESVITPAGKFVLCKKVEYRTKTEIKSNQVLTPELKAGETVTTIWFAPHVGIVKIHQESNKVYLNIFAESEMLKNTKTDVDVTEITSPTIRTLELKKYEIKSDHREGK